MRMYDHSGKGRPSNSGARPSSVKARDPQLPREPALLSQWSAFVTCYRRRPMSPPVLVVLATRTAARVVQLSMVPHHRRLRICRSMLKAMPMRRYAMHHRSSMQRKSLALGANTAWETGPYHRRGVRPAPRRLQLRTHRRHRRLVRGRLSIRNGRTMLLLAYLSKLTSGPEPPASGESDGI